jgi:hypothetical protein
MKNVILSKNFFKMKVSLRQKITNSVFVATLCIKEELFFKLYRQCCSLSGEILQQVDEIIRIQQIDEILKIISNDEYL